MYQETEESGGGMATKILAVIFGAVAVVGIIYAVGVAGSSAVSPTLTPVIRLSAAEADQATKTFFAGYGKIDPGELISYADKHVGDRVEITGSAFNVTSKAMSILLKPSYKAVIIVFASEQHSIYNDDIVTVYGTVGGFYTGKNTLGGDATEPYLTSAVAVK
jgi:hypothetical protein